MNPGASSLAIRLYLPLAMLLLVVALYGNALRNPFLLEDQQAILTQVDVISPQGLGRLWLRDDLAGQTPGSGQYRPITVASYHLCAALSGYEPRPAVYRAVNMLLLAAAGCLAAMWMGSFTTPLVGWLAALLMVAHPTHAQAINIVSGRPTLLATTAILGVLLLHRRAMLRGHWTPAGVVVAGLGAVLALGADTTGLLLAPLTALQAWLGRRPGRVIIAWKEDPLTAHDPPLARVHALASVLVGAPLALYVLGRGLALNWRLGAAGLDRDVTGNPLLAMDILERLPVSLSLAWFYLGQVLRPDGAVNAVPRTLPTWHDPGPWLGLATLAALGALLGWGLARRSWISLGLVMGMGQFLIVSHVLAPAPLYAATRLTAPLLVGAVAVLAHGLHRMTAASPRRRAIAVIPCAALVAAMALVVVVGNVRAASPQLLRRADLEAQPLNPVAMFHYGRVLSQDGRYTDALRWLERVVEARPESIEARHELAGVLLVVGRPTAAMEQYRAILQRDPYNVTALARMGSLALGQRDLEQARQHLQLGVEIAPQVPDFWRGLAQLHTMSGDLALAVQCYETLLEQVPADPAARQACDDLRAQLVALERSQTPGPTWPALPTPLAPLDVGVPPGGDDESAFDVATPEGSAESGAAQETDLPVAAPTSQGP